ncbi:MAG: sulfur oxidation c-type cytochrome SoxX [Mangrovicoccus sp.]|nr:sulfur oxidation c-type cytochrome SoxX [Mangrovicoccus sp.]
MKQAVVGAIALMASTVTVQAAETVPGDVDYGEYGEVQQSLTGAPGDSEAGREVVSNRALGNCVACHAAEALVDVPWHGEIGPVLDGAGSRWSEAELRGIVANAKMMFEGTMMPAFYKTEGFTRAGDAYTGDPAPEDLPPILTAQQVEDVVAYLMTLTDE